VIFGFLPVKAKLTFQAWLGNHEKNICIAYELLTSFLWNSSEPLTNFIWNSCENL